MAHQPTISEAIRAWDYLTLEYIKRETYRIYIFIDHPEQVLRLAEIWAERIRTGDRESALLAVTEITWELQQLRRRLDPIPYAPPIHVLHPRAMLELAQRIYALCMDFQDQNS